MKCKDTSISNYKQVLPEIASLETGERLSECATRMTKFPISFIEMQDLNLSRPLQENTDDHGNQVHMDQKTLQKEH